MELKSTEEEVDDIKNLYESLRRYVLQQDNDKIVGGIVEQQLPELSLPTSNTATTTTSTNNDNNKEGGADNDNNNNNNNDNAAATSTSTMTTTTSIDIHNTKDFLIRIESIQERLKTIQPKMTKFQKRLKEKDPVSDKPRYGEKTFGRVQNLIASYDNLQQCVSIAFHNNNNNNDLEEESSEQHQQANNNNDKAPAPAPLVDVLRQKVDKEEEEIRQQQLVEKERIEREERDRQEEAARLERQESQRQEEERVRIERQRQARVRQVETAIAIEERQQREMEMADRQWYDSINKGPNGVREQLALLVESTANDNNEQTTALNALHTIFSQICGRPEETNFRRIRRNHPKFNQDIGRHPGGKEILLAAGFELGAVDDVPCYICKEPNIEHDMDGWSAWFDLLKTTLSIIEEQLIMK